MGEVDQGTLRTFMNFAANKFSDEHMQVPGYKQRSIQVWDQASCLCWYVSGPQALVVIADKHKLSSCGSYPVSAQDEYRDGHTRMLLPVMYVKGWACAIMVGTDIARQLQSIPIDGRGVGSYPCSGVGLVMEVVAWCYMDATQRRAANMKWQYWAVPANRDWLEPTLDLGPENYKRRARYAKILDIRRMERELPDRRGREDT